MKANACEFKLERRESSWGQVFYYANESWGQVFHYEIATLGQLCNSVNAHVMQANACEFELERRGHSEILAKYDNERPNPFPLG